MAHGSSMCDVANIRVVLGLRCRGQVMGLNRYIEDDMTRMAISIVAGFFAGVLTAPIRSFWLTFLVSFAVTFAVMNVLRGFRGFREP
jgi:hypothetical protein